jgi:hypothetical protein
MKDLEAQRLLAELRNGK